ncbi:MAG: biopolymer transporter ExbD [Planctomycetes bacterium]|nr:biopolymer transporter ExbD [Planctomycetota bacterium]
MSTRHHPLRLGQQDDHLDLVPLIDCVFLLLLFFMICGRLSTSERSEQITVPPARTATAVDQGLAGWRREIINVSARPAGDGTRGAVISIGATEMPLQAGGTEAYQRLRAILDRIYDQAEKYDDPRATLVKLPRVIVEVRADGDADYRTVQEVQQVLTDSLDLATMRPRKDPHHGRPFVNLDFTVRRPADKG